MSRELQKPKILVFAGSTRTGSFNRMLARQTARALERAGAEVTLIDLRDFAMPIYDGDTEAATGLPEWAKRLKQLLREHDAFVIASPEYNGFFPALIKNVIDWASRAEAGERSAQVFRGKVAGLVSASPGAGGGTRGLRHLRELLQNIGVDVVAEEVSIARAHEAFDSEGRLVRPEHLDAIESFASAVTAAAANRYAMAV